MGMGVRCKVIVRAMERELAMLHVAWEVVEEARCEDSYSLRSIRMARYDVMNSRMRRWEMK